MHQAELHRTIMSAANTIREGLVKVAESIGSSSNPNPEAKIYAAVYAAERAQGTPAAKARVAAKTAANDWAEDER